MENGESGPFFPVVLLYVCVSVFIWAYPPAQAADSQSVYVRDSAVVTDKLSLAQRMEQLAQWEKSADIYQEILDNYSDRLVRQQTQPDGSALFISATLAVQQRLAHWPVEGLDVYRQRYQIRAAALLESANDDPAKLRQVLQLYLPTDQAKRAGIRLIDLHLEQGEFAAAAWLGDHLLANHPDLDQDRPLLLYRTALAYHLAGDADRAGSLYRQLADEYSDAMGLIRGQQANLSQSLKQDLSPQQLAQPEIPTDSWPMPFGSLDRARIPQSTTFGGARLFSIAIAEPPDTSLLPANQDAWQQQIRQDQQAGLTCGIMPVVDQGELFFHDNTRIYAVSLDSDQPLPGWGQTYGGSQRGRYAVAVWPTPRSHQCALAVTQDSVLAILGQPDAVSMRLATYPATQQPRLICLDRRTGREKWVVQLSQLPQATNLRDLRLIGSPLIANHTVYVQARGSKGTQLEDAYLLAFNLADGQFKWASYLASANATAMPWEVESIFMLGARPAHPAYVDGRIYVLTNLGALAVIDAQDGSVIWLVLYPQDPAFRIANPAARRPSRRGDEKVKPWTTNPVIVTGGKVFILPADGSNVHVYDAASGVEIKRISLSLFDNPRALLGVVDEKLILCNDRQVFCINWRQYDPARQRDDNLVWISNAFQRKDFPEDSIRGRGLVTSDSVIIPTAWQLFRLSLKTGAVTAAYPPGPNACWAEDEQPGNVLCVGDRLIIAGATRLSVYADLPLAMSKLDIAIAQAPDDPSLRLRYARMLLSAGKPVQALEKLDQAISLIAAKTNRAPDPAVLLREDVFNTALALAQNLAKEDSSDPAAASPEQKQQASLVEAFFDRVGTIAHQPWQKVAYLRARAEHSRRQNRTQQEIALWQEILSDSHLRNLPVTDADSTAGELAEQAIEQAIQRSGTEAYAPFEQAAADAFQTASARLDPQRLVEVAMVWPNSSSAPRALLTAAQVLEDTGNGQQAALIFRRLYARYPNNIPRAAVIESLARNYLSLPNGLSVAATRLKQASKLVDDPKLTRPLTLPDGRKLQDMTFTQAADILAQLHQASASRLPDFVLPPTRPRQIVQAFEPESPQTQLNQVATLLIPSPPLTRYDRIVTYTPGIGLRVYLVGQTSPIIACDAITQTPLGVAWVGPDLLFWTADSIGYISADDGALLWHTAIASLPPLKSSSLAPSAENPDDQQVAIGKPLQQIAVAPGQPPRVIIHGNRRIVVNPGGRLIIAGGLPQPTPAAVEKIVHVQPLSDRVIVGTTHGRVACIQQSRPLGVGKLLWQTSLSHRTAANLLANEDFVAARVLIGAGLEMQLVVLDSRTGQTVGRRKSFSSLPRFQPLNLALSDDGMLIWLQPDRICGKDLFEPGELNRLTFDTAGSPQLQQQGLPFQSSVRPEDLQIAGDRLIVVADNGMSVRLHDLRTGQPLRFNQSPAVLRLDASAMQGLLFRTHGNRLYLATSRQVRGCDIISGKGWRISLDGSDPMILRDLVVTASHVLTIFESSDRQADGGTPSLLLRAFSRSADSHGNESGLLEHEVKIASPQTITQWQVVDGGFYYLTGDKKLHFLRTATLAAK